MKKILRNLVMNSISLLLKILSLFVPKQKNLILFGSFSAIRFGDNAAALFKQIVIHHPELEAIWMTNSNNVILEIELSGWSVLKRISLKGIWRSLRANVVVTTHGIKDVILFEPLLHKPKWLYLHHGIPLKKGWFQIENVPKKSLKSSKDKIKRSDYMIATSEFSAELQNMFLPIGIEKIILTGLPRNDIFFNESETETKKIIKQFDLGKYRKILLYAPTWRDWETTVFFPFPDFDLEKIQSLLELEKVCIILRPHHIDLKKKDMYKFWNNIERQSNFKIITHTHCVDVNVLCKLSHCLITDYSSIYLDYLLLNRPIWFIPYDIEKYSIKHGFLTDYDSITPGPKIKAQKEMIENLNKLLKGEDIFPEKRNKLKLTIHKNIDGNASERIIQLIKDMTK